MIAERQRIELSCVTNLVLMVTVSISLFIITCILESRCPSASQSRQILMLNGSKQGWGYSLHSMIAVVSFS